MAKFLQKREPRPPTLKREFEDRNELLSLSSSEWAVWGQKI